MKKTWSILAVIAVATVVAYFALPIRFFVENIIPFENEIRPVAYDDESDGGTSKVTFDVSESGVDFSCVLGSAEEKAGWCGLIFDLRNREGELYYNRDWSFVDTVIFDVEASGTNEILVKLWAYDEDVTDTNVARTYRLLMKELPLTGGRQRVAIPLEQFYTPDFWYADNHVDTSLVERHQDEIVRLEIAPGWNQPRGQKFALKFYGIQAKGLSNATFGGVLFVMLILTIVAVGRKHAFEVETRKKSETNEKDGEAHA